jgi:predicted DNA-binding transcriptional regulator AlpA
MSQIFLPQDALLTTEEVAKRTGFSRRFWETRRLTGDTPPFIRISGRAIRYRWEDVEKWLAGRVRTSTSDHGESINNGGSQ